MYSFIYLFYSIYTRVKLITSQYIGISGIFIIICII